MTAITALNWLVATALLATLYLHTLVGLDQTAVTPPAAAALLTFVVARAVLSLGRATGGATTPGRVVASLLALLAWVLCSILTLAYYLDQAPTTRDVGVAVLDCGLPMLLAIQTQRAGLLGAIAWMCIGCALADAAWTAATGGAIGAVPAYANARTFAGFARYSNFGITGSTLASGLTGLVASLALANVVAHSPSRLWKVAAAAALLIILLDLVAIGARRYLGEAVAGTTVLVVPFLRRNLPLALVAVAGAAAGLWFTFSSADGDNILRGALMAQGWEDAKPTLLEGQGLLYRAMEGGSANFQKLWAENVTESGALSLVIAFGLPATIIVLLAVFMALFSHRRTITWPALLLALMTGELAYSDFLGGFLGTTVFFSAFLFVIFEEGLGQRREERRLGAPDARPSWAPVTKTFGAGTVTDSFRTGTLSTRDQSSD